MFRETPTAMKIVRDTYDTKGIPTCLHDLKDVFVNDASVTRGVYFLFQNEEIVYIGQSKNVYTRIQDHIKQGDKVFNRSFIQLIPKEINLLAVEKHYILKYRPKYNYETHAKSCEPKPSAEYITYELGRIVKPNRVDQVYLKEALNANSQLTQ